MLQHKRQSVQRPAGPAQRPKPTRNTRPINLVTKASSGPAATSAASAAVAAAAAAAAEATQDKLLDACKFDLPQDDSGDNSDSDSSDDCPPERGYTNSETSGSSKCHTMIRWGPSQEVAARQLNCSEFEMTNNCYDANNNGQGVDMQNLPSIAEQLERQRTWMTVYFRYRVNWYEARAVLCKMSKDVAYRTNNLPLWTRSLKVQLHRKTIFLNAIRAFRNRMQCAMSGVRFTLNAFYQEADRRQGEMRDGPESKPLPYFRCPDDMPDLKTMAVAQLNVFVSNSTSYFDQFWDESLKENS